MRVRTLSLVFVLGLVAARALASMPATELYIPSAGSGSGQDGSFWRTTLWVFNPGEEPAACMLQFLVRDTMNSSAPVHRFTVEPGRTVRFDDVISTVFGVTGYGALRVLADAPVVANARIYNQPAGSMADTQGQFFAAIPESLGIGPGEWTDIIGVNQGPDGAFRFNFGFVETTGKPTVVLVTLLDEEGEELAHRSYSLMGRDVRQHGLTHLEAGAAPTSLGRLRIAVSGGAGRIIAFGSGIANESQDPSTHEMVFYPREE